MISFFVKTAAAVYMITTAATPFEANIKLPNGSYQRVIVSADSIANAKTMLYSQYCPVKKDCVASGPHLTSHGK
jgi:hypothetical protein